MELIRLSGVCFLGTAALFLLRECHNRFDLLLRLSLSLILAGSLLSLILPLFSGVRELFADSGNGERISLLFRAAGITLIAEFSASFLRDLGENGAAEGLLLFGKLEILLLSFPLLEELLTLAKELLQW